MANKFEEKVKHLKNCLDALEKLKALRRELKAKLQKDGLRDDEEVEFAKDLLRISENIGNLEREKLSPLDTASPSGRPMS